MPQVGFESTISVFERVKAVHPLDRSATETCTLVIINVPTVLGSVLGQEATCPDRGYLGCVHTLQSNAFVATILSNAI
jgi:hypothetical protein